jgi:hypothetical protein
MGNKRVWAVVTAATFLGLAGCGSGGAKSSAGHPLGDSAIQAIDVVARAGAGAGSFQHPLDAAPSPDGSAIYFIAESGSAPAVLRVAGAGGAVSTVAAGAPLASPRGVAVATDGSHVYIADPQAGGGGAILTATTGVTGQVPDVLSGTEGLAPKGLDIGNQGPTDVITFTGTDPATRQPALFQVSSAGGTVTTLAEGAPFVAPDAVAVTAQGVAYVSDQGAGPGQGKVFRVVGATVTPVLTGLQLGSPAGVGLVNNDATLLVSSENAATLSDQVLFLDLASGKTGVASKVIGVNHDSSGGLHRANHAANIAWADIQGTVYRVRFP